MWVGRPHCDGSYETPDRRERSYFTLHLYLNDTNTTLGEEPEKMSTRERMEAAKSDLVGGSTRFHSMSMLKELDVVPKCGRILIFQQRGLVHSGDDVLQGVKYTMRTDLMYTLESTQSGGKSKMPVLEEPNADGGRDDDIEAAKKARARFGL